MEAIDNHAIDDHHLQTGLQRSAYKQTRQSIVHQTSFNQPENNQLFNHKQDSSPWQKSTRQQPPAKQLTGGSFISPSIPQSCSQPHAVQQVSSLSAYYVVLKAIANQTTLLYDRLFQQPVADGKRPSSNYKPSLAQSITKLLITDRHRLPTS